MIVGATVGSATNSSGAEGPAVREPVLAPDAAGAAAVTASRVAVVAASARSAEASRVMGTPSISSPAPGKG